jgi:hypothetical protein
VFLSDGSSKTQQTTFYKTNRVEKFLQKNRKKIQTEFSRFVFLRRFWEFLGEGSLKTHTTNFVSKRFYKKIDKNPKLFFFSMFVYHVFGRFLVRGFQKHHKSDPGPFLASDPPAHPPRGSPKFVLAGPLAPDHGHGPRTTALRPTT